MGSDVVDFATVVIQLMLSMWLYAKVITLAYSTTSTVLILLEMLTFIYLIFADWKFQKYSIWEILLENKGGHFEVQSFKLIDLSRKRVHIKIQ
jgi:hypothetical protein